MKKKVAVISGASKGIGKQLVIELSKIGYDIFFTYNTSKKEAILLRDNIRKKYNVNVYTQKCDNTNIDDILNLKKSILEKYDHIDLLINNASYSQDNYIDDKSKEEFMKVLEVNVVGTFLFTKYLYKYLDNGIIINISSTDSEDTYNRISMDYCASKAAINSLTKTFAQEFDNIKVIGVMPNWTDTESVKEMNNEYLQNELKRIGQDRLENPNDVAKKILKTAFDKNVKSSEVVRV